MCNQMGCCPPGWSKHLQMACLLLAALHQQHRPENNGCRSTMCGLCALAMVSCRWAAVADDEWPQQQVQRDVMLADFDFKSGFGDR